MKIKKGSKARDRSAFIYATCLEFGRDRNVVKAGAGITIVLDVPRARDLVYLGASGGDLSETHRTFEPRTTICPSAWL